jgi:hypothetical protein
MVAMAMFGMRPCGQPGRLHHGVYGRRQSNDGTGIATILNGRMHQMDRFRDDLARIWGPHKALTRCCRGFGMTMAERSAGLGAWQFLVYLVARTGFTHHFAIRTWSVR